MQKIQIFKNALYSKSGSMPLKQPAPILLDLFQSYCNIGTVPYMCKNSSKGNFMVTERHQFLTFKHTYQ